MKPKFGGKDASKSIQTDKQSADFQNENIDTAIGGKKILKGVNAEIPDQIASVKIDAPAGSEIRVKAPSRPNPYVFRGTCKITGHVDVKIDAEGISSKGRSRMKSKVKYQISKVWVSRGPGLLETIKKLNDNQTVDAGTQGVVFNDAFHLSDIEQQFDRAMRSASIYQPPKPRVKKTDATPPTPEV